MIQTLQVYKSISTDPYRNLAIEEYLLDSVKKNCCILYLWQNKNTVVIGKNQNGWKECRTELLKEEGGLLARRLSGGGAVFHDLGNLNFTFLVNTEDYDVDRQLTVIQNACHLLGIDARRSGRNDLLCMERKFSGNAFYKTKEKCYHHGTLLLHADTEKMSRYLNPSAAKLKAKGVDSVRSRVLNLCEVKPDLTVDAMMSALIQSFAAVYGGEPMGL
ncbi:MAG: lipoate--protein ligase, partial [Firmicutes bacterium]|nr:lipoate--protein ligase [Bacillota bacterium]